MGNWRDKAACRDMDPDLFFPATRKEERLALKACSTCPAGSNTRSRNIQDCTGSAGTRTEGFWS